MTTVGTSSSRPIRAWRGRFLTLLALLGGLATQPGLAWATDTALPTPPAQCMGLQAEPQLEITLMFGMRRPNDGRRINRHEWNAFMREVVTPRFPAGLTVLRGDGQWQNRTSGQIGREPSRIVWIVTPPAPDLQTRLETIRQTYRTRFAQQSVGLVVTASCAAF
ncbi:DUF3574 domain-containing protein [Komagataeibacter medellinensis]|uniref:DUF3574 domain-containing protein n=1 Tax=Komagataeibacter medellinensis TaxID=1177712 RepID=A0ABQ6VQY7_9PROT|nr:DUF3574 domain-containing protein [Komagataeibacter medellinensis]KAB8122364.1 DUF3574 domain-containing protein [Komagataeibacter medellinensis]